jgi:transmembrane sensor
MTTARADVYEEVADWYLRLDGERITDSDRSAFAAWLAESDARQRVYTEMASGLDSLMDAALAPSIFEARLAPLLAGAQPQETAQAVIPTPRWRFLRAAMAAAAGLALIVGLTFSTVRAGRDRVTAVATPVGATMTVKLDDGSTVYLNTDTRLTYALGAHKRSLRLERGEAYFEVAHDAARPFVVTSGAHTITDIGTAFDVKFIGGVTNLSVTDGVTRVSRASFNPLARPESRDVKAGMSAQMAADGSVTVTSTQSLDTVGAWRTGRLVYRDQPIAEIIADLGRYLSSDLVLATPARGDARFTVVLQVDGEPAMLKRMAQLLPITLVEVRAGEYEVYVK